MSNLLSKAFYYNYRTFEAMVADQLAPANGLFQYDAETQEGQQEWPRCPAAIMWSVRWDSLQARIQLMSTACTQGKPKSASTCLMNRTSSGFGHNPLRVVYKSCGCCIILKGIVCPEQHLHCGECSGQVAAQALCSGVTGHH